MIKMFMFCIYLILIKFSVCTREEVPRHSDLKLSRHIDEVTFSDNYHHHQASSDYKEYDNERDFLQKVTFLFYLKLFFF